MGLNIVQTNSFQFENRENLRKFAKEILKRQDVSEESAEKIVDRNIFEQTTAKHDFYYNPQLAIIKASTQISLNNGLKETLKYLKSQRNNDKVKKAVLGELWDVFNNTESIAQEKNYEGELLDFEIDNSVKNIFAA